jgi:hypothetical protein
LPLTTGVTGTLPVSNGGTGLTSLTAGYIPFGNGSSAFGNSSNLFWDATNSRLGIGTSSPATKLEVNGSFKAGGLSYPTADGTAGQYLKTDGSGNIGFTSNINLPQFTTSARDAASLGLGSVVYNTTTGTIQSNVIDANGSSTNSFGPTTGSPGIYQAGWSSATQQNLYFESFKATSAVSIKSASLNVYVPSGTSRVFVRVFDDSDPTNGLTNEVASGYADVTATSSGNIQVINFSTPFSTTLNNVYTALVYSGSLANQFWFGLLTGDPYTDGTYSNSVLSSGNLTSITSNVSSIGAATWSGSDFYISLNYSVTATKWVDLLSTVDLTTSVSGSLPIANGGTGATTAAGARTNLGLGNVDNTSDLNKPISTATQTALNAKQNALTNPVTGTGTSNKLAKFSGTSTLTDSNIIDNGTVVSIATDAAVNSLTLGRGPGGFESNTVLGSSAFSSNTSGIDSAVLGFQALKNNTTGASNVAIGKDALYANIGGSNNVAIGRSSLLNNTTGISNVAVGLDSALSNTTGNENIAVGQSALRLNTTGVANTAIGRSALSAITTGNYNSALGWQSLAGNTTGIDNVAVGYNAGRYDTTGTNAMTTSSFSVYLGASTKGLNATGSVNETVIGNAAVGLGSNSTVIGNTTTTKAAIYGALNLPNTTTSTTTTTGALTVGGGVGIVENLNVGGDAKIAGTITVTSGAGAGKVLTSTDSSGIASWVAPAGVTTMAAIGSTPNANGATISGANLNLEPASATYGGVVTTGAQTFAGAKTFSPVLTAASGLATGTKFTPTLTAAANADILVGLDIDPTFTNGSYSALTNYALRVQGIGFGRGGGAVETNTAIGSGTLINNTTGANNTGLGYRALLLNSTGSGNTAFGTLAGAYIGPTNSTANSSGTNSTFIGYNTSPLANGDDNEVVIAGGNATTRTVGLGTNTTLIGNAATTQTRIMGALDLPNNTASSSTTSGALKVAGGAGIAGNAYIGGTISIAGGTPGAGKVLTSTDTSGIASWATPSGVPYSGATGAVNLGAYDLTVNGLTVGRGGNGVAVSNVNATFGIGALSSGSTSGSGANTAIGNYVLGANTSGSNNTGLGFYALGANVTGKDNTAVGYYALNANNSSSSDNTAVGSNAMYSNTSGTENTAVGTRSLYKNISGVQNSVFGTYAYFNGVGSYNTAVGYRALMSPNASGNNGGYNASLGSYSGYSLTTGSENVFLGSNAGYSISTGNKNIFIGNSAGSSISGSTANTTGLNSVLIGYDVRPLADADNNEIVLSGYNGTAGTVGLGSNTTLIGSTKTQKSQLYGALTVVPNTATASTDGNNSVIAAQNAGTGATNAGGSVNITAGNGNSTGLGGNIVLTPGTSTTVANNGIVQVNGQIKITGGTPAAGEVLVSDANGLATWSNALGSAVTTTTAAYAITLAESIVFYTGTAAGTFSIPAATAYAGKEITIKNKTAFGITITPATGTIYIDNANAAAANVSIGIEASNNWIKLVSDGTQWNVLRALF